MLICRDTFVCCFVFWLFVASFFQFCAKFQICGNRSRVLINKNWNWRCVNAGVKMQRPVPTFRARLRGEHLDMILRRHRQLPKQTSMTPASMPPLPAQSQSCEIPVVVLYIAKTGRLCIIPVSVGIVISRPNEVHLLITIFPYLETVIMIIFKWESGQDECLLPRTHVAMQTVQIWQQRTMLTWTILHHYHLSPLLLQLVYRSKSKVCFVLLCIVFHHSVMYRKAVYIWVPFTNKKICQAINYRALTC